MRRRRRNPMTSFDRQFLDMLSEERRASRERKMFRTPVRELSDKDLNDFINDAMDWMQYERAWNSGYIDPREIENSAREAEEAKAAADRGREIVSEIESRPHLTIVEEQIGYDEDGAHYSYHLSGVRSPRKTELSEGAVRALELADGRRGLRRTNPVASAVARRHNSGPQRRRHHRAAAPYNNPIPRTFVTSEGKTYNTDDVIPLSDEVLEIYENSYRDDGEFDLQDVAEVDKAMRFWWQNQPKISRHIFDRHLYKDLRAAIPLRKADWDKGVSKEALGIIDAAYTSLMDALTDPFDADRKTLESYMEDILMNPVARAVARRRNPTVDLADLHPSEMKDSPLANDYYLARDIVIQAGLWPGLEFLAEDPESINKEGLRWALSIVNEVKNRPHIKVDRLGKIVDIDYREDTYGYPQDTIVVDSRNIAWRDYDGPSLSELLAKNNPRRRRRLKRY